MGASAIGQQPHAGASADTRALNPVNRADSPLHASPPSSAHLISYIKNLEGGKKKGDKLVGKKTKTKQFWRVLSLSQIHLRLLCYLSSYVSYYVLTGDAFAGYIR